MANVANRQALPERNVLRVDILRAPLDFISKIIEANHWGFMYTSACPVHPRLVREFYGYLEVVQDNDHGIILQTIVQGKTFQIDPQAINKIIGVPIQPISANPFSEVIEPPNIEKLRDYFDAHAHIKINASLPCTGCSRRLFCTIYGPQLVEVRMF